jgi:hypothetical protein
MLEKKMILNIYSINHMKEIFEIGEQITAVFKKTCTSCHAIISSYTRHYQLVSHTG